MDFNGNWTGTIVYGRKYRETHGKELYFDMALAHIGDHISGTASDTGGTGVNPDPAEINGVVTGNSIRFVKQYASYHYLIGGKSINDKSRKGPQIFYSGTYDAAQESFAGEWTIKGKARFLGLIPVNYTVGGTWTMRRK